MVAKLLKNGLNIDRIVSLSNTGCFLLTRPVGFLGITLDSEQMQGTKGRFCNTIASVALFHTSIQSDKRMQKKEILSSRNSKETKPQSCPETSTVNSRLVRVKGVF